jgi:hypothetical protein
MDGNPRVAVLWSAWKVTKQIKGQSKRLRKRSSRVKDIPFNKSLLGGIMAMLKIVLFWNKKKSSLEYQVK